MFTPSRFNAPSQEIETSLTSPLPGCKIEQSCFPRSKYYSEIYGEFFGSLLPLEPTSMTTVEHRRDKDMVPILVEIELKVNQYNYLTGVYERRYLRTFVVIIWLAPSVCQHIFLELLNQRFRRWNAPSPLRRFFVDCTCRRDTHSERARSWPGLLGTSGVWGGRAALPE